MMWGMVLMILIILVTVIFIILLGVFFPFFITVIFMILGVHCLGIRTPLPGNLLMAQPIKAHTHTPRRTAVAS